MKEYTSSDIKVLDEITHIQKNAGMYIGSTENPIHLVEELIDNSLDECVGGYATVVAININTKTHVYSVIDNGRGIPLKDNVPVIISTKLFSGAKFQGDKTAYTICSGKHGVGLVTLTALSDIYKLEIYRDNQHALFEFKGSKLENEKVEEFLSSSRPFSTKVIFKPSRKYFEKLVPDIDRIRKRLLIASVELPKCTFALEVDNKREIIRLSKNDFFQKYCLSNSDKDITPTIISKGTDKLEKFSVMFNYCLDGTVTPKVTTSINLLPVDGGGTHVNIFYDILRNLFSQYKKKYNLKFQSNDCLCGLRAYLSLSLVEPEFSSQTKDKLINRKSDLERLTKVLRYEIEKYFQENEDQLNTLLEFFEQYRRKLDSKNTKTSGIKSSLSIKFTKLRDCSGKDGELYICEGDSGSGCVLGSTRIKLIDGRNVSISKLVEEFNNGKENFVYTYNCVYKKIEIEKIQSAKKTRLNAELIKVNLDNNCYEICTPDHLWMLRDGSYKEAKDLKFGDSLMPIYTKLCRGDGSKALENDDLYEWILQPNSRHYDLTHWLSDKWNENNNIYDNKLLKFHRHHHDFNTLNNNPSNIKRLSQNEHLKLHWKRFYNINEEYRLKNSKLLNKIQKEYWSIEENRKEQSKRVTDYFKNNPEAKQHNRKKAIEQWSNLNLRKWRSEKTKEQLSDPKMRNKIIESMLKTNLNKCLEKISEIGLNQYIEFRKTRSKKYMKVETIINKFFNGSKEEFLEIIRKQNHKVISIEKLNWKSDVYDLEIPNTHNFALSSGVFIHNSFKTVRDPTKHAILPLKGKVPNITSKKDILKHNEIGELIRALGCGVEGVDFDINKLKYSKIIIATDADPDGDHIASLLILCLAILVPEVVKRGHVYIVRTPLYAINEGKIFIPLWTENELKVAKEHKRKITRYKGIGEFNPNQIKICALNEKNRKLIQVSYTTNINKLIKLFSSSEEKRKLLEGSFK